VRRKLRSLVVMGVVLALGVVAGACGGAGGGAAGVRGTITVSGSSTVQPITSLVAELFNQINPDVDISVDGPGTSDGFVLFCNGDTEIQDASRPIEPEEEKACTRNGIDYVELEVALDGITVMTSRENTAVTCLSTGDLYALFGPESEGIASWSDAESLATQVGGRGAFPQAPLEITAPGQESGTYDAFIELSGISEIARQRGLPEDDWETLRVDYQASPNDNVIIQAMSGSPSALGFVGFAYADKAGDQVRAVAIDGGAGCVEPSTETIADGSYPLARSLYIYVNKAKLSDPAVRSFVDFYMTDEGLRTAVIESDYIPLPQRRVQETRSQWQRAA
jgi:phosphate transport system substrate-binding protein